MMRTTPDIKKPTKIIKAGSSPVWEYLHEVWLYRNLIWIFAYQEFRAQYVQTRLTLFWIILRPLIILSIFTFVFDHMIHITGLSYPYPLFAISGLLLWNNFSYMVNNTGSVIVSSQSLIKKYYFPRVILILSKSLIGLIEFGITFLLLLLFMIVWRFPFGTQLILFPFFILITLVIGGAVSIWVNALTIKHRDLHQLVPTLAGFMIWLTPVFYSVTLLPKQFAFLIYFNPMAGAIQGFRWAVLGDPHLSIWYLPSFLVSIFMFVLGFFVFIRAEAELADYI